MLALATLISEDATCVLAGIGASRGELAWSTAFIGCLSGIILGDGLLWYLGHTLGRKAVKLPIVRQMAPPDKLARAERWFAENGMWVVLISRCLPGSRFATYLCAGLLGSKARSFILLASAAATPWTIGLVWLSGRFGDALLGFFETLEAHPFLSVSISLFLLLNSIKLVGLISSSLERAVWRAKWARRLRWEFLPLWLFQFPVLLFSFGLALRYRGLRTPLLVNPGIPFSGFVGESKAQILTALDDGSGACAKTLLFPADEPSVERLPRCLEWMQAEGLEFPVIVKPDVGQRGSGVRKIETQAALEEALASTGYALLVQEFIDLPCEYGVFYVREPHEAAGRITGITLKEFPFVVGDGTSTIEELIVRHPRQRLWVMRFLQRLGARVIEVPADGERILLAAAGNHCQGTTFRDGTSLRTPELEDRIDELCRKFAGGFFFGRFDVRVASKNDFQSGRGLRVIELNGVTGEGTHIYDPDRSLLSAYRELFRQWHTAFRIGAAHRKSGMQPPSYGELWRVIWRSWRESRRHPLAD